MMLRFSKKILNKIDNQIFRVAQCNKSSNSSLNTNKKLAEKIGFIGDGNMAKAICQSIILKNITNYPQIYVSSPFEESLKVWKEWGTNTSTDNGDTAEKADIIFIAIKPIMYEDMMEKLIRERKDKIKNKLFVSVLVGTSLKSLENYTLQFEGCRTIRVMPNTPMMVGEGCTVYCPGKNVTEKDLENVVTILKQAGMVTQIPEYMINGASALIASGPAFAYLVIQGLTDGAIRVGVNRDMAKDMAAQTVLGAAKMALLSQKHIEGLKDDVCSSGGTTIAGIHAMEKSAVRGAMMDAVEAAAKRAKELMENPKEN